MNHKGQTLVIFVFLIPVFIMILALVVDLGLVTNANIKYTSLAKECIKTVKKNNIEEGKKFLEANNLNSNDYEIIINNEEVEVIIKTKIDAIFGTIINMKEYEINIKEKG